MRKRLGSFVAAATLLTGGLFSLASPAHAATENDYLVTGAGPGGGPHVKLWNADGTFAHVEFQAYGDAFRGGVDVAMGDLDGDAVDEIITGAGAGGGPHVKVFDIDGNDLHLDFMAYPTSFSGGVNVGVADVDNDGDDEIITGAGPGGGPHVKAFDLNPAGDAMTEVASFMAGPTTNHSGVDVTGVWTDIDNPETPQFIATSDLANGGGLVRIFDTTALSSVVQASSFKPYPGFGGGARIASADIDNDGRDEIVTGAGPGGGPHVKTFASGAATAGALVSGMSFMAYNPAFHGGVDVGSFFESSAVDNLSVVTGAGPGGGPHVLTFDPPNHSAGPASFQAYGAAFGGGVHVDGGLAITPPPTSETTASSHSVRR
jgi:hypothetical protein